MTEKAAERRCMTWQRMAHNPEVAGSNPAPATGKALEQGLSVFCGDRRGKLLPNFCPARQKCSAARPKMCKGHGCAWRCGGAGMPFPQSSLRCDAYRGPLDFSAAPCHALPVSSEMSAAPQYLSARPL
jgi:hypothetical protein